MRTTGSQIAIAISGTSRLTARTAGTLAIRHASEIVTLWPSRPWPMAPVSMPVSTAQEHEHERELKRRVGAEGPEELPERASGLGPRRRWRDAEAQMMCRVEFLVGNEGAADSVERLDDRGEAERGHRVPPDQRERAAHDVADGQRPERDAAWRRRGGPTVARLSVRWLAVWRRLAVLGLAVWRWLAVRRLAVRRGLAVRRRLAVRWLAGRRGLAIPRRRRLACLAAPAGVVAHSADRFLPPGAGPGLRTAWLTGAAPRQHAHIGTRTRARRLREGCESHIGRETRSQALPCARPALARQRRLSV